ncbi:hypothetical protein FA95DRAFT_1567225 [Auriscalpium vulgare]|uniref:Uncharacterized protein n=1 Tax=Auriscalpium vulgare TaxID=40419 RepID=A0ACB8R620_9AGAM|nr:hypothetical protein FA95DRAFT_1567225 [Auriscalpium vulgare]
MQTLTEDVQNLHLADTTVVRKPRTRTPMHLPLPPDIHTNPRVQFYGYEVSEEWLIAYGRKAVRPESAADMNDFSFIATAMKRMKRWTRISTLSLQFIVREDGEESQMISICSEEEHHLRPIQAQVDALTEVVGKQPRWYTDAQGPEFYEQ